MLSETEEQMQLQAKVGGILYNRGFVAEKWALDLELGNDFRKGVQISIADDNRRRFTKKIIFYALVIDKSIDGLIDYD